MAEPMTLSQMREAALVGVERFYESLMSKRKQTFECKPEMRLAQDINGACGELFAATSLGLPWDGHVKRFADDPLADIGEDIQVKTTFHHDGHLILTDKAKDSDFYILVTGIAPFLTMRGWILARHGKQERWLKEDGSWWVPQPLNPMSAWVLA